MDQLTGGGCDVLGEGISGGRSIFPWSVIFLQAGTDAVDNGGCRCCRFLSSEALGSPLTPASGALVPQRVQTLHVS